MDSFGIIGGGVVGSALANWFGACAHVYDIDPLKSNSTLEEVFDCPWIFFAANLKDNCAGHGYDIALNYLRQMRRGTRLVVKTTIVPGTCDRLQADAPHLTVMYNPEFLVEAHPEDDFRNPHIQVAGTDNPEAGNELLSMLPSAPSAYICTRRQAELLKHANNSYLATKVSWFNQLYEAVGEVDFYAVRAMMAEDPRIGPSHTNVDQDRYRGWSGKCFTKDVPAFANTVGMPIVKHVVSYNRILLMEQGLDEWAQPKR